MEGLVAVALIELMDFFRRHDWLQSGRRDSWFTKKNVPGQVHGRREPLAT